MDDLRPPTPSQFRSYFEQGRPIANVYRDVENALSALYEYAYQQLIDQTTTTDEDSHD